MLNLYHLERQTVAYVDEAGAIRRERAAAAGLADRAAKVGLHFSRAGLGLLPRLAATWTRTARLRPLLP